MARVMFDLDGVLRDWDSSWRQMFLWEKGYLPKTQPVWEAPFIELEAAGFSNPKKILFEDWGYELTYFALAYPDAYRAVQDLKLNGHKIVIATHQPTSQTRMGTLAWLSRRIALVPDELYFTDRKYEVEADYYIEDNDNALFRLVLHRPDRVIARMLRPWNENCNYAGLPVVTVKSLADYVELINNHG